MLQGDNQRYCVQTREQVGYGQAGQAEISDGLEIFPGYYEVNNQTIDSDDEDSENGKNHINSYHCSTYFGGKYFHLLAA